MQEVAMSHIPATRDPFVAQMPFRTPSFTAAIGRRAKEALRHWQRHRMMRTLWELDDRTLDDIGLARSEIRGLVDDLVGPSPRRASQGQTVRSSVRRDDPEDPSPTGTGRRPQINDVKKSRFAGDVYQSWRDL
jgi:uncharacterized protein YjiS (DUF1127 family)